MTETTLTMPKDFAGFLDGYPLTKMNQGEMTCFLNLSMLPSPMPPELLENLSKSFLWQIMDKRCKAYGVTYDPALAAVLMLRAETPAHAVVVAYTLALIQARHGGMTLRDAVFQYFGIGLPDLSQFNKLWESQKVPDDQRQAGMTDNLIDVCEWSK